MKARTRIVGLLAASALAALSLVLPARRPAPRNPTSSTGGVSHVSGTTAELDGTVNPEGLATSYYFKYGPTTAYGSQTKPVSVPLPNPPKAVKVGQTVTGLLPGYHYRIVGDLHAARARPLPSNRPAATRASPAASSRG